MLGVVVQIDGFDPVLAQAVTLRAGSHDDPAVCHVDGSDPWWPALIKLPTLRYDLFDGAFAADITAPSSSLTIAAEPWPNLGRYALADARLRLWTGEVGMPWGSWTLRFDGRISEQPELGDGVASINFAVDDRWLDTALLATYAGTSGPEGTEALKGQPKPLALGAPRYVAGTLIDNINSVFQLSAYGPLHGFDAALERLARFGNPAGDFASYAALVAANVPAGRWATAKAVGMARLGAPPTGQISFLIAGDEGGPNGWARRPGQIIRRLALLSKGAGRINDASLNALDVARPYNLSVNVEQQTTARQLIQQIAASVNAVAGMSWTGQLFVVPVGIGAPGMTLAADGSALPPVASVKQIGIASPFQKLAIGAARAWTVHALSDIAFTAPLIDLGTYVEATTYREGNIVSLADGSRWLYINLTAGAGHAPPAGSPGDAYWSNLSAAIDTSVVWDDILDPNGTKPADNATVGAPAGTPIGDRDAQDVLDTLDVNVTGLLEQALRQDDFLQVVQAWSFVEGQPVSVGFLSFRNEQLGVNSALASQFTSVFAKAPSGTGYTMNLDLVKAGNATLADLFSGYTAGIGGLDGDLTRLAGTVGTLSAKVSTVVAESKTTTASVKLLQEAFATDGGGFARFVLKATVDGNGRAIIAGISGVATSNNSELNFAADSFNFVSTVDGTVVKPFSIVGNAVYTTNLVAGSITYDSLVQRFTDVGQQNLNPEGWYQVFPGGMIQQGGRYRGSINSETTFAITFPRPFPNQVLAVGAMPYLATFSNVRDLWIQNVGEPSLTGTTFATQAADNKEQRLDGFDWWAWGK